MTIAYMGRVDTNLESLKKRIIANSTSLYNLEEWIVNSINFIPNRILDLGCGTGKQIQAMTAAFPKAEVIGIDVANVPIIEKCKIIKGSFEDLSLIDGNFDLITSIYAIYYSKHMVDTIIKYKDRLNENGILFLVGPGNNTNREFIDLYNDNISPPIPVIGDFIDEYDMYNLSSHFSRIEITRLANKVVFNSVEDFMKWWENHNMYVPLHRDIITKLISVPFELSKNVMGVKLC